MRPDNYGGTDKVALAKTDLLSKTHGIYTAKRSFLREARLYRGASRYEQRSHFLISHAGCEVQRRHASVIAEIF